MSAFSLLSPSLLQTTIVLTRPSFTYQITRSRSLNIIYNSFVSNTVPITMARASIFQEHLSESPSYAGLPGSHSQDPDDMDNLSIISSIDDTLRPFDNAWTNRRHLPDTFEDELHLHEKLGRLPSRMRAMGNRSLRSIRRCRSTTWRHICLRKAQLAEKLDSKIRLPLSNSLASLDRQTDRVDSGNTLASFISFRPLKKPVDNQASIVITEVEYPWSLKNITTTTLVRLSEEEEPSSERQQSNDADWDSDSDTGIDTDTEETDTEDDNSDMTFLQLYIELLVMRNFPLFRWEIGHKTPPYKKGLPLAPIPESGALTTYVTG
jgi:hypothetical protein